ncbi:MAG: oxidoreductase [Acidobacteria bacterium]|nr:MAG: oxidoreductase [Acidobacteriota bacterium]
MDWRNKVALITGASSGIGRGLAFALARRGAAVGLLARREHVLQSVVLEIEAEGGRAISLPADVRDAEAMRSASGALHDRFGPVDLLVANAGIGATTYAVDLCEKAVADLINVNVIGVVNSVTAVIPQMVKRGSGHLVAISSLAAYRGLPKSAAYCASKAATSALFEGLRIDLLGTGVDVTIIHPGFIKTPLTVDVKRTPYLMELDEAVPKILRAIEKRRKGYSFPWQLASIARACMLLPNPLYDWLAIRNAFRE